MIRTINFNDNGSKILIISGIHGNEVGTINLSFELYHYFSYMSKDKYPIGICNISFIHSANKEGIRNHTRNLVFDSNLNNPFTPDSDPKTEIIEAIKDADYVIDLHCSPYIARGFLLDNDEKSLATKNFLDNQFYKELYNGDINYLVRSTNINSIKSHVNSLNGKIGFTWEQNGMDRNSISIDKSKDMLIKFIYSIHDLKIPEYNDKLEYDEIKFSTNITTPVEGILIYYFKLGDFIQKNSIIGVIRDINTYQELYRIISPVDGKFVCGNNSLYVNCYDIVAFIQPK